MAGNQRETAPGLFLPLFVSNPPRPVWRCCRNRGPGCPVMKRRWCLWSKRRSGKT